MKNPQTTISGWIAAAMGLLAFIATVPTELQAQLMAMFPHTAQPYAALIFAVAAFAAKGYQAHVTQDSLNITSSPTQPQAGAIQQTVTKP